MIVIKPTDILCSYKKNMTGFPYCSLIIFSVRMLKICLTLQSLQSLPIFINSYKKHVLLIDLIGVLKTVMHYGYSGISRETNLLSEEIDLYISQEKYHNASRFSKPRWDLLLHYPRDPLEFIQLKFRWMVTIKEGRKWKSSIILLRRLGIFMKLYSTSILFCYLLLR